jgi:hypothetical protein
MVFHDLANSFVSLHAYPLELWVFVAEVRSFSFPVAYVVAFQIKKVNVDTLHVF